MFDQQEARQMTIEDLALLGVDEVAYVVPIDIRGVLAYAVHTADGKRVAVFEDLEMAAIAIQENELEPVWAH